MDDFFGAGGGGTEQFVEKHKRKRAFSMAKSQYRETFDFGHFDYNVLRPTPGLAALYNRNKSIFLGTFRVVRFSFSVTSVLIITTQVMESTDPERVEALGYWTWRILGNVARFMPVPMFLAAILQFNNFFAERMYYKYLQRGAIIDFPETGHRSYLLTLWRPRLFLAWYLLTMIFVFAVLLTLGASLGSILIFSNAMTSIGIFWLRNQSVEAGLISLTSYIQSFKDSNGDYLNIDDVSLTSAASNLTKITLVEADHPCYSSYMRHQFWKLMNIPGRWRWFLRVSVYLILAVWAILTVIYGIYYSGNITARIWRTQIYPCTLTCFNIAEEQMSDMGKDLVFNATNTYAKCYCRCITALGQYGYHRGCGEHMLFPDSVTDRETVCSFC